jgi:hypothetical protein
VKIFKIKKENNMLINNTLHESLSLNSGIGDPEFRDTKFIPFSGIDTHPIIFYIYQTNKY